MTTERKLHFIETSRDRFEVLTTDQRNQNVEHVAHVSKCPDFGWYHNGPNGGKAGMAFFAVIRWWQTRLKIEGVALSRLP